MNDGHPCPICGADMKVSVYTENFGVCEEQQVCPNNCYSYEFLYGDTQIAIGGCIIGYSYRYSDAARKHIDAQIKTLIEFEKKYREEVGNYEEIPTQAPGQTGSDQFPKPRIDDGPF